MPTVESTGRATALLAAALQTDDTPAPTASKGAVTGVIPLTNGGKVPNGGGNGAAVCP